MPVMLMDVLNRFKPQAAAAAVRGFSSSSTAAAGSGGGGSGCGPPPLTLAQRLGKKHAPAALQREQEDAHEFLDHVVDALHQELLALAKRHAWEDSAPRAAPEPGMHLCVSSVRAGCCWDGRQGGLAPEWCL